MVWAIAAGAGPGIAHFAALAARKEEMIDFGIIHHMPTDGNKVYIKQMHVESGSTIDTHKHNFDHFGILGKGVAVVELDGIKSTYYSPCVIEIKAGKTHKITAESDLTWFCVHAVDSIGLDSSEIDKILIKGA